MKNIILIILLTSAIWSCDITKQASKTKSETSGKEYIETITKRIGDTVTYTIPNIVLKDTTIYSVNRQGTTLRTVYNSSGNISSIDCFASAIEEMRKENREFQESIKNKDKKKTEEFDSGFIISIVAGISFILIIALLLIFFYINKHTKTVTEILNKIK